MVANNVDPMPDAPLLNAQNLTRYFHGRKVLHGIHLELHRGEVLGFLGPNGAGKSTTMKILSGNQRPAPVGMPRVALWRTVEAAFGLLLLHERRRLKRRRTAQVVDVIGLDCRENPFLQIAQQCSCLLPVTPNGRPQPRFGCRAGESQQHVRMDLRAAPVSFHGRVTSNDRSEGTAQARCCQPVW